MNEKKEPEWHHVNVTACQPIASEEVEVAIHQGEDAEVEERWSVVGKKAPQRW
jgi:hypothetical protein